MVGASSGGNALERFRSSPEEFDLVITDQTMPGMTGEALARKILEVRGGMPVLLCSGLGDGNTAEEAEKSGIRAFLMKPISMGRMARVIREVLDASAG